MNKVSKYLLAALVFTTASCAVRVTPTGGEKDVDPPKIVSALPDTFSTNFNSKTIEFEFNEYYQLNDLSNKLVISPPMEKPPIAKIKGKKLVLELQEPLRPNTTYNFNFGSAIADVNEGNAIKDFNYVFSTGTYIDSLSVSGSVVNAYTGAAEKDVTVLLYTQTGDSLPYKSKPAYFAKTNDIGAYNLNYVAPGKYKIFALKETNNNYLLDAEDEQIAFTDSLVDASQKGVVFFKLFQPEKKKQKVLKKDFAMPGKLTLQFNKPTKNFKLRYLKNQSDSAFYFPEIGKNRDTVTVWLYKGFADTLKFIVYDEEPIDTITFENIRVQKRSSTRGATADKPDTTLAVSPINIKNNKIDRGGKLVLRFNHPVDSLDYSKIRLLSEGSSITYQTTFDKKRPRHLSLSYPFSEDVNYSLQIEKHSITDIYGYKNDSISYAFSLRPERDYGSLQLKLTLPDQGGNYILQLLNDKGNAISEYKVSESQRIDFGQVEPGSYSYRLIEDKNNNGRWDTGNYLKHLQPEQVLYSTERPNVRAAWDLETEWNLNSKGGKGGRGN